MHLRSSMSRGIPVVDDGSQQVVGFLDFPLIEPDTGRILGFFIHSVLGDDLFLQSVDISAWGTKVHVRDADRLSPPQELIRLKVGLGEPRTFLGQQIRTKYTNRTIGICSDVQFNTRHFMVEWLFPRKFFLTKQPLPVTDVLEVTTEAIWVKDPFRAPKERVTEEKKPVIQADTVTDVLPALGRESAM